jgi:rhodanese-related sulfurtransferase
VVQLTRVRFFTLLLTTIFTSLSAWALEPVKPAEVEAWLAKHPGARIVDVRTPEEFATGHLKGAQLIDWKADDFEARVKAALDPAKPVLLICRSGRRSTEAAKLMEKLGFTTLAELHGGMLAWVKAGLPIEAPKP